jgi:predicted DNA-binding transcriptional regulator AlpA
MLSPLLTQRETAAILAISVRSLERMRMAGGGPRFIKVGHCVRYRPADVEAWIAGRLVTSTSEQKETDDAIQRRY